MHGMNVLPVRMVLQYHFASAFIAFRALKEYWQDTERQWKQIVRKGYPHPGARAVYFAIIQLIYIYTHMYSDCEGWITFESTFEPLPNLLHMEGIHATVH